MIIGVDFGGSLIKVTSFFLDSSKKALVEGFSDQITHRFETEKGSLINFLFKKQEIQHFYDFLHLTKEAL